jgi:hypothetical protein
MRWAIFILKQSVNPQAREDSTVVEIIDEDDTEIQVLRMRFVHSIFVIVLQSL